jgi:4-amino-4-deoxy-L-arabinose transferase-like glycosyltransferase
MAERLWPQAILEDRRTTWVLWVLMLLLFTVGNLPWQLDDYDQAKQAFTSFQMVQEGRWLYQTTPHERIVATKPPMVGWISAGLFELTRSWNFAWRFPSLLTAVSIAVLLFRFSRSAYGNVATVIAVAAFGFNLMSPRLATLVRTDMPLALVIFVIGGLIWNKVCKQEQWRPNDRLILFILLTAGMLIKGPVVWAFLVPGIVAFQLWRNKPGVSAFTGVWPWMASLAVFLCWVVGGIYQVPGFYEQVVQREFLGRFGGEIHRAQPLLFYLPHLLHKFAPWSLLLIVPAVIELRAVNWKWRAVTISPATRWLICWSIGGLVVMSLLPSKRVDRIFPVIPPLCLLLGAQIGALETALRSRQWMVRGLVATLAFAMVFTSAYVGWKASSGFLKHRNALARLGCDVRTQAVAHHWRYAILNSPDEGLLLYLRLSRFLRQETAVSEWNDGRIDALVVPTNAAGELLPRLNGASRSNIRSAESGDGSRGYSVLVRQSVPNGR